MKWYDIISTIIIRSGFLFYFFVHFLPVLCHDSLDQHSRRPLTNSMNISSLRVSSLGFWFCRKQVLMSTWPSVLKKKNVSIITNCKIINSHYYSVPFRILYLNWALSWGDQWQLNPVPKPNRSNFAFLLAEWKSYRTDIETSRMKRNHDSTGIGIGIGNTPVVPFGTAVTSGNQGKRSKLL